VENGIENMENNLSLLAQAGAAAGRKDKLTARKLLDELVFYEPGNEQAWLLLAEMVDDLNEVTDCLQHALAINPHNQATRDKYENLLLRHPKLVELDPVKAAAAKAVRDAEKAGKAKKAKAARAAAKAEKAKRAK
jgi:hypothetical protein